MDFNTYFSSFGENMERYNDLDLTFAIARAFCGEISDLPPPQAVPLVDWFYPLEETTAEDTPLVATSPTWSQLLEDLRTDLVAPLIDQQQSLPQPAPVHCQTQFDNQQTVTKHLEVKLRPIEVFEQKVIYGAPGDRVPDPVNTRSTRKGKLAIKDEEDKQYIKRPPNAFLLYRKEKMPKVLAELKNSATVNTVIGQMWKALSKKGQKKYYEESERLRQIHSQLYPDWSARDNYGKKRKRSLR